MSVYYNKKQKCNIKIINYSLILFYNLDKYYIKNIMFWKNHAIFKWITNTHYLVILYCFVCIKIISTHSSAIHNYESDLIFIIIVLWCYFCYNITLQINVQ